VKNVYSGGASSLTPNEKHEFANNLVRTIADTEAPAGSQRQVNLKGQRF